MTEGKQNTGTEVVVAGDAHTFLLRRTDSPTNSFVRVDFSPIPLPERIPTAPETYPIHATYNLDRHYFTPAFTLPLEQLKTQRHLDSYLKLHQQRMEEMVREREQLWVAKPSRSNSFCCICRAPFEDYLTHVNLPAHQELLRGSAFRAQIVALGNRFNISMDQPEKVKEKGRSRKIKKCTRRGKKSAKMSSYLTSTTICIENDFQQKQLAL